MVNVRRSDLAGVEKVLVLQDAGQGHTFIGPLLSHNAGGQLAKPVTCCMLIIQ